MDRHITTGIYRHFKGILVEVLYFGIHTETEEPCVVYKHIDTGQIWIRPLAMFISKVDKEKYPDAAQEYRFEFIKSKEENNEN